MGFTGSRRAAGWGVALSLLVGGCARSTARADGLRSDGGWSTVVTVTSDDREGASPPAPAPGPVRVSAVYAEETAICSGGVDTPTHRTVITADVTPPRAGVEVVFELTDHSPATKPARLSPLRALTDVWGHAWTTLLSSNTPELHQIASVRAHVAGQTSEPNGPHAEVEFMVSTNAEVPGLGPVVAPPVKLTPLRYARHPSLVRIDGTLYLLWTEQPRSVGGERFGLSGGAWPVRWQAVGPAPSKRGLLLLPTMESQHSGQRVAVCGLDGGLLFAFPQSRSTAFGNPKAALAHLPAGELRAARIDADASERAVLAPGARLVAPMVSASGPRGELRFGPGNPPVWSDYDTDARRFDLAAAPRGPRLYCCGEEWSKRGGLWLTFSDDGARRWAPFTRVPGKGIYPCITVARKHVVLLYVQADERRLQSQWPDDEGDPNHAHFCWPDSGRLVLRTIGADLHGWSLPTPVVTTGVISARCAAGPDGRLWVVYLTGDERYEVTTLWLIHSDDLGKTWSVPEAVTDGKTIDRDPFLLVERDALYLAFARGREWWRHTEVVLMRRER